jgi:hypothetical protein
MDSGDVVQDIDPLILQKRRERGLEPKFIEDNNEDK